MKECICGKNWDHCCPEHGGENGLFIKAFNDLAKRVHGQAKDKGFWEPGQGRSDGELIVLMHSELSEALEAIRHGNPPDDMVPAFSGYEVELADCIMRIMDTAAQRGLKVAEALIAKMTYNQNRSFKHGKKF